MLPTFSIYYKFNVPINTNVILSLVAASPAVFRTVENQRQIVEGAILTLKRTIETLLVIILN